MVVRTGKDLEAYLQCQAKTGRLSELDGKRTEEGRLIGERRIECGKRKGRKGQFWEDRESLGTD